MDDEERKKRCKETHRAEGFRDIAEPVPLPSGICVHLGVQEKSSTPASRRGGGAGNSAAFVAGWESTFSASQSPIPVEDISDRVMVPKGSN